VGGSLDPCTGGPYPFEYALSETGSEPGTIGDVETAVMNVQQILRDLGYTGKSGVNLVAADGWFGSHTAHAVRSFRRDHGIDPVGTVDDRTWEAPAAAC
jgi:peptidoglycan hydrolase-like protein with peptidoglycan-binding domain